MEWRDTRKVITNRTTNERMDSEDQTSGAIGQKSTTTPSLGAAGGLLARLFLVCLSSPRRHWRKKHTISLSRQVFLLDLVLLVDNGGQEMVK